MAIPGTPGTTYTADGLEHAERGTPSSLGTVHLAQLEKRLRKLETADYGDGWADVDGDGELAVVTFGSCTGVVREALARARERGLAVKLVSLRLLSPLRPASLAAALAGVRRALVVEQNHGGQLLKHLRAECDLPGRVASLHRPGALQFSPGEIHHRLVEWSRA
jgi:2-oxoglutarate ferredoxin oxidoreductase subunit alpha